MVTVRVTKLKCGKCRHEWYPRSTKLPDMCPKCKSRKWQEEAKVGIEADKTVPR